MISLFAFPWAFLGLLTLGGLAGVYLLRNRYRRQRVSCLALWMTRRETRGGGTRVRRLRTPWVFFIELLILALLTLAAARPFAKAPSAPPLMVVLDDSFSMLAGQPDSPRARAVTSLKSELASRRRSAVRLILASDSAETLGDAGGSWPEAETLLKKWTCEAPNARIAEAVALAGEMGGPTARILVLTDHAPKMDLTKGRVAWRAFGKPLPNLAIVNAARGPREKGDRVLLEIANYAAAPCRAMLNLKRERGPAERRPVALAAGATRRLFLELPKDSGALTASLPKDAILADNEVVLLPERRRIVRVSLRVVDDKLERALRKALEATGEALLTDIRPAIILTDGAAGQPPPGAWVVRFHVEPDSVAYLGPFVVDRSHPLMDGVPLAGVVWGAGQSKRPLPGRMLIMAGNTPLVSDATGPGGGRVLHVRLRPDLSTLTDAPAWPTLVWNVLKWRLSFAPGMVRSNVRVGDEAQLNVPRGVKVVSVSAPDKRETRRPASAGRLLLPAEERGVYRLDWTDGRAHFAANLLAPDESNLARAETGVWGGPTTGATDWETQSVAWAFLLPALGLWALHLAFVARRRRTGGDEGEVSTEQP